MELKPGCKRTEVGVIPVDWECVESGAIVTYFGGNAFKSDATVSSGVRWLKIANVGIQRAQWTAVSYLPQSYATDFKDYLLREGDVVVALTRPILGNELKIAKLTDLDVPSILNQRVAKVVARSRTALDFVYHALRTRGFVNSMEEAMAGTDPPNIGSRAMGRIKIAVPPTDDEQRAIATALSDVDALISALDQLIAKKRDLKQAAMQQLLTSKLRLPGFNGEWAAKRLGNLAQIINGGTPKTTVPGYWNGSVNWCTPTDVTRCLGKYLLETERTISHGGLVSCSTRLLPAGSLLLCSRATIGEIRIAGCEICTNQGFKSLICEQGVSNEFLYYKLLTMKPQILERAIGSTFLEISKKQIASLEISLPEEDEQIAIATVLSDMDAELAALEQRRDKTRALKQGMMQELLTGKTRLV